MEKVRVFIFVVLIFGGSLFLIQKFFTTQESVDAVAIQKYVSEETSWATTSVAVSESSTACSLNGQKIPCEQFFKTPSVLVTFALFGFFGVVYVFLFVWAVISIIKTELPYKILWLLPLLIFPFIASIVILFILKNFEKIKSVAKHIEK